MQRHIKIAVITYCTFVAAGASVMAKPINALPETWLGVARSGDWTQEIVTGTSVRELAKNAQPLFDKKGLRLAYVTHYLEKGKPVWFGIARSGEWKNRLLFSDTLSELKRDAGRLHLVYALPYKTNGKHQWFGIARSGDWTQEFVEGETLRDLSKNAQELIEEEGLRLVHAVQYATDGKQRWFGITRSGNWGSRLLAGRSLGELTANAARAFKKGRYHLSYVSTYIENDVQKWFGIARTGNPANYLLFGNSAADLVKNAQRRRAQLTMVVRHSLEDYVQAQMEKHQVPGMALAVVAGNKVLKVRTYGLAEVERRKPVTQNTKFQLASVTKIFTGIAVVKLASAKKLNLDDHVGKHLEAPDAWREITIRHLLSHTSGIPDYLATRITQPIHNADDLREWVAKLKLDFKPGADVKYSNSNFVLLGEIIRKVSGKPYDEYLTETVFKPLGATATHRRRLDDAELTLGYVRQGEKLEPARRLDPAIWDNADGGLVTTIDDAAKLAAGLMTERVLSKRDFAIFSERQKLKSGGTVHYGLGCVVNNYPELDERVIGGGGSRSGTHTNFTIWTKGASRVAVVVLCNVRMSKQFAYHVGTTIAQHYLHDAARK